MIWRMQNTSVLIKLPATELTQLRRWERAQGTPQQVALRCRIILAALTGRSNVGIAEELGVSRPTVQLWRQRVEKQGIGQVWQIARDGDANLSSIKRSAHGSLRRLCTASPRA